MHRGLQKKKYYKAESGCSGSVRRAVTYTRGGNSSNFKALMSDNSPIHQGPPAVYQLKPKKEMIGTLTRVTVGEKDQTKLNKTILLVGETGTGKSTLTNALFNYAVGVKFKDEVWFQIVEDEKRSETESQTSDVIVYEIFGFEDQTLPFSLTIIDTPGYGDTRGKEKDEVVSQRLRQLFQSEDGVHELHAVGLVMKATDNRLSDRLKYIYDSVMSLFGKDLERNIVALVTHSDGGTPENVLQALNAADIKCSKDENDQPVHFLFNNQQKKQRNTSKRDQLALKLSWDFTNEEMDRLRDILKKMKPQPLKETVKVMKKREQLIACIENVQEKIKETELKKKKLTEFTKQYEENEEKMKNNENFSYYETVTYKDKKKVKSGWHGIYNEGTVICNNCEENCHVGCTNAWTVADCKVFQWCSCTVCTNKCTLSAHSKVDWKYVTKTKMVLKTKEDMKARYNMYKEQCEEKSGPLDVLKSEMTRLTTELSMLLDEAWGFIVELEQIALKADSMIPIDDLSLLIEKMNEKGDKEKVKTLERLNIRRKLETTTIAESQENVYGMLKEKGV
ncbi:septin-14 isoform X1 [Fundulus heteroclitus]|uniref:septin-14 isoform X1 n=1 Tax=Fundulus heteroclitus TaxID=8078 RepID=UPI00165B3938|nr:septin-14 isoform X1 [Fundulus heteroclitus]